LCSAGEGVVPKQTHEVEAYEGRSDGSRQGDRATQAGHDRTTTAAAAAAAGSDDEHHSPALGLHSEVLLRHG